MGGYLERVQTEVTSVVKVNPADTGTADVSITLETASGVGAVELISRVSREDLPRLVLKLYGMVSADQRADLLDALKQVD